MLLYIRAENLHGVRTFLAADPGQPPMTRGDMCDFVVMDNLQSADAVHITCLPELVDGHGIHIQAAGLVHERDDADSGAEVVRGSCGGFPESVVDGESAEVGA